MLITILLAVSGILIGAGLTLVVRDWLFEHRISFLSGLPQLYGRDRADEADVGVRRGAEAPLPPAPLPAPRGQPPAGPSPVAQSRPAIDTTVAFRPAAASNDASTPGLHAVPLAPTPAPPTVSATEAGMPMPSQVPGAEVGAPTMSRDTWNTAAPTLALALKAINGAFARAGAQLVEASTQPVWDAARQGYRLDIDIDVASETAARLIVVMSAQNLEIATYPAGPGRNTLARQQRLPLTGLTVPRLAEAIASCAWPSVAGRAGQRRA